MRILSLAMALGLIGLSAGPPVLPPSVTAAADSDAGPAIETVDSHCAVHTVGDRPIAADSVRLDCVAIYRNGSDRPVFDIRVAVRVGGRPVIWPTMIGPCCDLGTRSALAPGVSALWRAIVPLPDGVESDASVTFDYSAAWVGDAVELDAPTPQLQYIDHVQRGGDVGYIGEVGNTDGRSWSANEEWVGDGELRWRAPAIAFFRRGRLSGAEYASWRAPGGGIAADGRYLFGVDDPRPSGGADSVQVFFRDEYAPASASASASAAEAQGAPITPAWELIGLDHQLESPAAGLQRMTFRVSVRNAVDHRHRGWLHVIARRADFHALGIGRCELSADVAPGATASCSGVVDVPLQRGDVSLADVRFVTVELDGGVGPALGAPAAPVAPVPGMPCPPSTIVDPREPPRLSLPIVVGRVWLPWATRAQPERCP